MPFIQLTVVEHGCSDETKRDLIKAVSTATSETLNIRIDGVVVAIHVLDPGEYGIGGETVAEIWAARAAAQGDSDSQRDGR
jgi:4-oxalocrotonate tautomerase family enzyme